MTTEITDLATLNVDDVQANQLLVQERIKALNPLLDPRRGAIRDLLMYYGAVLQTQDQTNITRWRRSNSLAAIAVDPTLADATQVDLLLSNYGVLRQAATQAQGPVTLVVSGNTTVTIPAGTVFTAGGQQYTADQSYIAKSEASLVLADTDRLLAARTDGNYEFTIDVTAVETGGAGLLRKDSVLAMNIEPLNFIQAFASGDFTNGLDVQDNVALMGELKYGLAAKTLGANRTNMTAWVKNPSPHEPFGAILSMSVIGHAQAEQIRYHSLFPVAFGGRMDWYVRTAEQVIRATVSKTATLVEILGDNTGIWQVALDRDDAPGFYDVTRIYQAGQEDNLGSFLITEDVRSFDLEDYDAPIDIETGQEAAYSRFQTAVLKFHDTLQDVSALRVGDTADYQLEVRGLPLIDVIQDVAVDTDHGPRLCDVVVRAPVPCFVSLSCTISRSTTDAQPDLDAIKTAVAGRINQLAFAGRLTSSMLYDTIYNYLSGQMTVSNMDLVGTLRYPSGAVHRLRSTDTLTVPDAATQMVSFRTVQFFTEPAEISIAVATQGPDNL